MSLEKPYCFQFSTESGFVFYPLASAPLSLSLALVPGLFESGFVSTLFSAGSLRSPVSVVSPFRGLVLFSSESRFAALDRHTSSITCRFFGVLFQTSSPFPL